MAIDFGTQMMGPKKNITAPFTTSNLLIQTSLSSRFVPFTEVNIAVGCVVAIRLWSEESKDWERLR